MTPTNRSLPNHIGSGWQILGEIELHTDIAVESKINAWMEGLFKTLDLPRDIQDKVLKSALRAATRVLHILSTNDHDHIHLLIFGPVERKYSRQTWGFFRIEKIEADLTGRHPDHTIEFYLYQEGE